uniref:Uncharacterized protein n=1 Tax=Panagrolaimus sp. JU765 TaxID=591449 RepID=A0AC34QTN0_9BILA
MEAKKFPEDSSLEKQEIAGKLEDKVVKQDDSQPETKNESSKAPSKRCPEFYFELFMDFVKTNASPKRCFPTYYVDLGTVQEFSLLGEEKFHLMLEHFRKTKKIELEFYNVLFISETYWAKSTVGFKTGTDQNINSIKI